MEHLDKYRADLMIKVGRQTHNEKLIARGVSLKVAHLRRNGK